MNSSKATSSVHYSGANVSDDKEKPVGKDSVPNVNWYWCGVRHWAESCRFGRRNTTTRLPTILHGCVNGAAGSYEIQIISKHQLEKKVWPTHYSHCLRSLKIQ